MGKIKNIKINKRKERQIQIVPKDETEPLPPTRVSDEPIPKKERWTNRQRVLVFAARGINHRDRHLMKDIRTLMPHHRPDAKMERSKTLAVVNDVCKMKHCNKAILLEGRRKRDLYMWVSNVAEGPSAKFLIENINTMGELKLTGNCLRGSRPLLSFDPQFDTLPYLSLLKEMFIQTFGVPNHHPKSQPFIDHVYTFTFVDKRIWFRNFQILSEDGGLAEVGPRFVMNPVKIFEGSFGGAPLWENPDYVSPSKYRQMLKKKAKGRYLNKLEQKVNKEFTRPEVSYKLKNLDDVFQGDDLEQAEKQAANDENVEEEIDEDAQAAQQRAKLEKQRVEKVAQLIKKKKAEGAKPLKKSKLSKKEKAGKPKKTIKKKGRPSK